MILITTKPASDLVSTTFTRFGLVVFSLVSSPGLAVDIDGPKLTWENRAQVGFLNYEWRDKTVEGATYFNSILTSVLAFKRQQHTVGFGVRGIRRFGDEQEKGEVQPWLQINTVVSENLWVIAGSLDNDQNFHQAVISEARGYEDIVEEGLQLRQQSKYFRGDHWINWHRKESADKTEAFEVGSVNRFSVDYLNADLQLLANHVDGQKTEDPTSLRNNVAVGGLSLNYPGIISPVFGGRVMGSTWCLNDEKELAGKGVEVYLSLNTKFESQASLVTTVSSFRGEDFRSQGGLAPYGQDRYQFAEISYVRMAVNELELILRVRAESFRDKTHTTQQIQIGMNF